MKHYDLMKHYVNQQDKPFTITQASNDCDISYQSTAKHIRRLVKNGTIREVPTMSNKKAFTLTPRTPKQLARPLEMVLAELAKHNLIRKDISEATGLSEFAVGNCLAHLAKQGTLEVHSRTMGRPNVVSVKGAKATAEEMAQASETIETIMDQEIGNVDPTTAIVEPTNELSL